MMKKSNDLSVQNFVRFISDLHCGIPTVTMMALDPPNLVNQISANELQIVP